MIVMPVFNDWESFKHLVRKIDETVRGEALQASVLAVNDGSVSEFEGREEAVRGLRHIHAVDILHLTRNLGHQRAIAVALAYAEKVLKPDAVVVMDSDGEDRPEDILELLTKSTEYRDKIIFARRAKRSEGVLFRLFYRTYKVVYRVLTGSSISFGNFCLIPSGVLKRLVFVSEIWNHFSAGVIRSRLPFVTIPTVRGKRIEGPSRMSLSGLIIHGLSAIAVHMDTVAVRLLLTVVGPDGCCPVGMGVVVGIRFLTDLAIPGWATNVSVGLVIILMQAFLVSLFLVFMILTLRTQKVFVPHSDHAQYVLKGGANLPCLMNSLDYVGTELDLFSEARNWKAYLRTRVEGIHSRPSLGSRSRNGRHLRRPFAMAPRSTGFVWSRTGSSWGSSSRSCGEETLPPAVL